MRIVSSKDWGMKIKSPLQPLNLSKVDSIALHHMAHPTADIYEVERWHLNQGWRAFGYNYWVAFNGTIYEGRGYQHMGAGVENQNDHIISIGFQGNYHSGTAGVALSPPMPDAQFNAGVELIQWLLGRVPTIKKIGGHRDFMATVCPGDRFPLAKIQSLKKRGEIKMFKDVPENDYAYKHIQKLLEFGIVNGDGNGNFKPDEPVTRRDVAVMIANALRYLGKW